MNSKSNHLSTSAESINKSERLASRLRVRIIELVRKAGKDGLTINEAERQIDDHKGQSISPRFAELVRQGVLVRVLTGRDKPTKRSPNGVTRYRTRFDDETQRNVTVHWVPEFAPSPEQKKAPMGIERDDVREEESELA